MIRDRVNALPEDTLFDTAEVALIFQVSPENILKWVRLGYLEHEPRIPRGHLRFTKEHLINLLEKQSPQNA